jgi:rhomboid family GlyGly-CTERM serine protease
MMSTAGPLVLRWYRFPLLTPILTLLAVAATVLGGDALELRRGGEAWRILTCHFTHFSYEQLAWNALAFLVLGIACERRSRVAFHATLLASGILVPLAVLAIAPGVTAYRGLSGIDSALFALLLIQERRSRLALLCGVAFLAKITFELFAGSAVFVSYAGKGLVPVPIAHVAGALAAVVALWMAAGNLIPYTRR